MNNRIYYCLIFTFAYQSTYIDLKLKPKEDKTLLEVIIAIGEKDSRILAGGKDRQKHKLLCKSGFYIANNDLS